MAKQESMEALMDATIALLARKSPAALTVRDIAAEAGVNHGLVHHYFGSKGELVRAAALRASRVLFEGQPAALRLGWTLRFFRERPELVRILARLVLDADEDLLPLLAPPGERLRGWLGQLDDRFGAVGLDPRMLNGLGAAALMGWFLFKPLLEAALDVPASADDDLARLVALVDAWLEGDGPGQWSALGGPGPGVDGGAA